MTDTRIPPIPSRVTVDELPVISAVRYGTATDPVEYIAIVDCGEGTPTHRYATLHLYVRPGEVKARDGEYDLTWQQTRRSLADRAGLIPVPHVEVVVLSHEPGTCDEIAAFVDGEPAPPTGPPAQVTGHVLFLDTDDEEHWWMVAALRGIDLDQLSEEDDQL